MAGKSATILIADDDKQLVRALTMRCRSMGFHVESTGDGLRALLLARRLTPDLIILDIAMPEVDGLSVCRTLMDPKYSRIPVIFLTGASNEDDVSEFVSLGAHYCKKGSGAWDQLKPVITAILGHPNPLEAEVVDDAGFARKPEPRATLESKSESRAKKKALIVDDDPDFIMAFESRMRKYGLDTVSTNNGMEAFRITLRERPDIIITDYNMPDGSGDWLIARLRSTNLAKQVPIIVVSGNRGNDPQLMHHILDVRGADAYMQKPFESEALIQEIRKLVTV